MPDSFADLAANGYDTWMPGGVLASVLLAWELMLAEMDGREPATVAACRAEAARDGISEAECLALYRRLLDTPVAADFPYDEPDELAPILALRDPDAARPRWRLAVDDHLRDRMYGGWLGRCVGCTLGGPGESFRPDTRARQKRYLQAFTPSEWPIRDYLPLHAPCDLTFRGIKTDATRGQVRYAPQDDDLTHTMLGQIALGYPPHPLDFETRDVLRTWFCHLPVRLTEGGTALMAFRNVLLRYPMRVVTKANRGDDWIDWHWVRTHGNPYREDLDASLRADAYGYACPGLPTLAAELAWRDARASNTRNGIYCAMLYAAMLAAAFALDDPRAVIERGLAEIPVTSRLYTDARTTIAICDAHRNADADTVHDAIYAALGDNDCGVSHNMALVLSALLCGYPDFEKVVTWAVMGGWDCDCTGASAGSIAGVMRGAAALPATWTAPLNDTVKGGIPGYESIAISECARRHLAIAAKVLDRTWNRDADAAASPADAPVESSYNP